MEQLIKALATALPEVEGATKDKTNPHFKSKYADLGSVIEAIRPAAKHGLWFRQAPIEHSQGACIETFYVHTSGEQMSAGQCFVPASKNDAQGFGSALTYARRYGLMAAFGIAPEDDDGQAAVAAKPDKLDQTLKGQIADLAAAADVALTVIIESYNVKSLDDLTAEQAQKTINRLKATIKEKEVK